MRAVPVWKLLALAAGAALAGYGLLCLLVVALQRRLMYFPSRLPETAALDRAAAAGLRPWRDGSGSLVGWRPLRPGAGPRILVFHGNAGCAVDRAYYLPLLAGEVLLLEYPGYGARPGSPSQEALVTAAVAALDQAQLEAAGPVWLLGESLGSGVACMVAARRPNQVAGLLLVTPLARMTEVAQWHYPYLPVRVLLRDCWDSLTAAASFPGPAGLLIAGRDEVVGADQGHRLAAAFGPRARVWTQPAAGHNTLDLRRDVQPWPEIRGWMAGSGPER